MSVSKKPLFEGVLTHPVTQYVNVPVVKGMLGCHIAWKDATSSAAITIELSSFPVEEAVTETAGTYQWKDSAVVITGPAASAAGSVLVNVENVRQSRARLKIVTAATSTLVIYNGDHPQ